MQFTLEFTSTGATVHYTDTSTTTISIDLDLLIAIQYYFNQSLTSSSYTVTSIDINGTADEGGTTSIHYTDSNGDSQEMSLPSGAMAVLYAVATGLDLSISGDAFDNDYKSADDNDDTEDEDSDTDYQTKYEQLQESFDSLYKSYLDLQDTAESLGSQLGEASTELEEVETVIKAFRLQTGTCYKVAFTSTPASNLAYWGLSQNLTGGINALHYCRNHG